MVDFLSMISVHLVSSGAYSKDKLKSIIGSLSFCLLG